MFTTKYKLVIQFNAPYKILICSKYLKIGGPRFPLTRIIHIKQNWASINSTLFHSVCQLVMYSVVLFVRSSCRVILYI